MLHHTLLPSPTRLYYSEIKSFWEGKKIKIRSHNGSVIARPTVFPLFCAKNTTRDRHSLCRRLYDAYGLYASFAGNLGRFRTPAGPLAPCGTTADLPTGSGWFSCADRQIGSSAKRKRNRNRQWEPARHVLARGHDSPAESRHKRKIQSIARLWTDFAFVSPIKATQLHSLIQPVKPTYPLAVLCSPPPSPRARAIAARTITVWYRPAKIQKSTVTFQRRDYARAIFVTVFQLVGGSFRNTGAR